VPSGDAARAKQFSRHGVSGVLAVLPAAASGACSLQARARVAPSPEMLSGWASPGSTGSRTRRQSRPRWRTQQSAGQWAEIPARRREVLTRPHPPAWLARWPGPRSFRTRTWTPGTPSAHRSCHECAHARRSERRAHGKRPVGGTGQCPHALAAAASRIGCHPRILRAPLLRATRPRLHHLLLTLCPPALGQPAAPGHAT